MNDPFERLRDVNHDVLPDVDAIRQRAKEVLSRQRSVLLGSAGVLVIVLAVAVARPWTASIDPAALTKGTTSTPKAEPSSDRSGERLLAADGSGQEASASSEVGSTPSPVVVVPGGASAGSKQGVMPPSSTDGELTLRLTLSKRSFGSGERVLVTLQACNKSQHRVETTFNSGKREDFEVYRAGEIEPVWTWSSEKSYTQEVGKKLWEPTECQSWEGAWSDSERSGVYKPGRYEIVGVLASEPPQKTSREAFCLGSCP